MQQLTQRYGGRWRPIHTFVSEEAVWQQRVEQRWAEHPEDEPTTWERIGQQCLAFEPWPLQEALFLDTLAPLTHNIAHIHAYLRDVGD